MACVVTTRQSCWREGCNANVLIDWVFRGLFRFGNGRICSLGMCNKDLLRGKIWHLQRNSTWSFQEKLRESDLIGGCDCVWLGIWLLLEPSKQTAGDPIIKRRKSHGRFVEVVHADTRKVMQWEWFNSNEDVQRRTSVEIALFLCAEASWCVWLLYVVWDLLFFRGHCSSKGSHACNHISIPWCGDEDSPRGSRLWRRCCYSIENQSCSNKSSGVALDDELLCVWCTVVDDELLCMS